MDHISSIIKETLKEGLLLAITSNVGYYVLDKSVKVLPEGLYFNDVFISYEDIDSEADVIEAIPELDEDGNGYYTYELVDVINLK